MVTLEKQRRSKTTEENRRPNIATPGRFTRGGREVVPSRHFDTTYLKLRSDIESLARFNSIVVYMSLPKRYVTK